MRKMLFALLLCALLLNGRGAAVASAGAGLEGTVTHGGAPVANAVVQAGGERVQTDAAGRFRFPPFAVSGVERLVDVSVVAPRFGTWKLADARLVADDTLRLTVELGRTPVTRRQSAPRARTQTMETTQSAGSFSPSYTSTETGSVTTPPGVIRVWVTGSNVCDPNAKGTVVNVDFKQYVKHVLPHEWFASWPQEALRAGAMAAKGYGWHQVARGGKWPSLGADVMDSQCDQVYDPTLSYASTDKAVDETWNQRMTRNGAIHVAFYRAGTRDDGANYNNDIMYQWGTEYWARQGMTWDGMLNHYYENIVISATTDANLRLSAGAAVSSAAPTWGEPFRASFTVHNYGTQSMQLRELYVKLRGPGGQNADLGGDNNATSIAPGSSRTIQVYTPALAAQFPRVYGTWTLTATYRDPGLLISPGLPVGVEGTSTTRALSVAAPRHASSLVSLNNAGPSYYEGTTRDIRVQLRNDGNTTWHRAASAQHNATRLATDAPLNRQSPFYVAGHWLSASRVQMVEATTSPGATATFVFRLSGNVAPGAYTESFRLVYDGGAANKYAGAFGTTVTIAPRVLDDTTPPTATLTTPRYSTLLSSALQFPVTWSGADTGSGVAGYEVQRYDAGWKPWLRVARTGATFGENNQPVALAPGRTYALRLRAYDRAGNMGAWTTPKYTTVPYDDAVLGYSGAWRSVAASEYDHYRRTTHYADASGARMTFRFHGRNVAWLAAKGPNKGKAQVWIDGVHVATVDLYSSRSQLRTLVYRKYLGSRNAYHTIQIRVLGQKNAASTGARIDVDGVAVGR
ncbi:MAG: hypothetical protein H0V86_04460 [Chloroflexia bacterium]|nr:hypothetical protein [Chloroflexia bacterium]